MSGMTIRVEKMFPDAEVPVRASRGAVGYDVRVYHLLDKNTRESLGDLPAMVPPGEARLFGMGLRFAVKFPIDCQVRPRSGLANKFDMELGNAPGTIDPDYRGEASILLRNKGAEPFEVKRGMRVAQLVFTEVKVPHFEVVSKLPETKRAGGGFGSTGLLAVVEGDAEYLAEQRKWDLHFLGVATSSASLSNCLRGATRNEDGSFKKDASGNLCGAVRKYGCVIVKDRNIVASGFNHRNSECDEVRGCIREVEGIPTGTANDRGCHHAEGATIQNHLRSGGPSLLGATVYVNAEPCLMCAKLISGAGIAEVVVPLGVYSNNGISFLMEEDIEVRRIKLS